MRCDYDTLLSRAPADALERIAPEHLTRRHGEAMAAMARLRDDVAAARLDALIVVGDDQEELFHHDNMPAIGIYYGETIRGRLPYQKEIVESDYPCDAALARHLIAALQQDGFDLSVMRSLREGQREGHAFSFVHRFYLPDGVPIVPVFLNAYYPPNQPSPARCVALGEALRRAVEAFPGDARIGVMASGGLSHFVVDEAFDHALIEALRRKDCGVLPQRAADQADVGQFGDAQLDLPGGNAGADGDAVGELCARLSHAGTQRHGAVLRELQVVCGRYASFLPAEALRAMFDTVNATPNWEPTWNMAPTRDAPVVRLHPETRARHLDLLRWGLVPHWAKDPKSVRQPINARAETLATSSMFRDALERRRCLVPADVFYEWQAVEGAKLPFAVARADGDPMVFAGLWEGWRGNDGTVIRSFTIVTTNANPLLRPVHERMPVILERTTGRYGWAKERAIRPRCFARPAAELRVWRIGTAVNSVRNDSAALLEAV